MDATIVIDATSAALAREVEELTRRLARERAAHRRRIAEIERERKRREDAAFAAGFAEGAALADGMRRR